MSREIILKALVVLMLLSGNAFAGAYGGGTGEPNNPYLIYDAIQMNDIGADANDWDKCFKLMANIDLGGFTGESFNIIGYNRIEPFSGIFDGNDHIISNFTYTSTERDYVGLFRFVDGENAEIRNLRLIDLNVGAVQRNCVGSLVGRLQSGKISNCHAKGSVTGEYAVGGLVGRNDNGTITHCSSESTVNGNVWPSGGLVGYNEGIITNCYATGNIEGGHKVGGLVGENDEGKITNCYATGSVSGNRYVGGLVGENNEGTITNCYSIGNVTGTEYTGGFVGFGYGHVINSYWNLETSGQQISAGGKGKSPDQMMMESTFFGWGFCDVVWTINENLDYPRLTWEEKPGEPIVHMFPLEGNGDANSPYLVHTPDELNLIGLLPCTWDKHFKLMADIDLSVYKAAEFNIIANFTGVFDGNDHTISNFTYSSNRADYIGLFGSVRGENAEISNLRLIDPNVYVGTGNNVGSLVGRLESGTITNCYAQGCSVTGDRYVGGLVGRNDNGTITNCYATGSVAGENKVGGLVGYNSSSKITNCYFTGSVMGNSKVGGLVGDNSRASITNCYTIGSVTGNSDVGGLVGDNFISSIANCYSSAVVTGNSEVGGLVGYRYSGTVHNSFWNTETSGQLTSDGGTGRTTGQMQMKSTFTDAGWDFAGENENGYEDTWRLCNEGAQYPKLIWQYLPGDFLCPDYIDFVDFAYFAGWWPKLDLLDLTVQTDNWLAGMTPGPASNPVPFNLATGVSVSGYVFLNWTAGSFTTSHDVYFGTSSPPPFVYNEPAAAFYPGIMERYTRYHWRIDGINTWGKTTGPVWTFTTGSPGQATNPDPFNGARGIALAAVLSWDSGFNAVSHDVYFGTSSPPPFIRNQSAATFYPDTMTVSTQYYWRIDEVYEVGSKITGPAWTFTTTSGGGR